MSFVDWLYIALQAAAIIGGISGVVSSVVVWLLKNSFVSHKDMQKRFEQHDQIHAAIEKRFGSGDTHFTKIDGDVKHAPTHEDLEGLRRDLAALSVTVGRIDAATEERGARMERMEGTLDRLVDFHLRGNSG